jgi:hypothetical protein
VSNDYRLSNWLRHFCWTDVDMRLQIDSWRLNSCGVKLDTWVFLDWLMLFVVCNVGLFVNLLRYPSQFLNIWLDCFSRNIDSLIENRMGFVGGIDLILDINCL